MDHITPPTQIRNAFLLLWASFAIATLESVIALFVPGFSKDELDLFMWWFLAGSFLLFAANAYIIYCASRRKNWARIVLLGLTVFFAVLILALHFMWRPEWGEEDWWSNATSGACVIMDALAIYWLFTGAGARWYAAKEV